MHGIFAKDHAMPSSPTKSTATEVREPDQISTYTASEDNAVLFPSAAAGIDSASVLTSGSLRIVVLGAQDGIFAGTSEHIRPYVVVKVGDKEQKTKHIGKTTNFDW